MIKKTLLLLLFSVFCNHTFGQKKNIKILNIESIKYYYVYKAFDFNNKDTIVLLSSKKDKEFKLIKLEKDSTYHTETRPLSAIKISEGKYIFCKPTINIIDNIKISNRDKLPVLILDSKKVKCGDID